VTLKEQLREGDTLIVWRLDRLGRNLKDLIDWVNYLDTEQVALKSLQENIDTDTPTGKLVFHLFGALAEFERNLIVERTNAGLQAARARGVKGGRKRKLDASKLKTAQTMYDSKKHSIKEICQTLDITKPTLYKYLKR
jgi:DNA invertase Pin-like site-specific DNA recombinase